MDEQESMFYLEEFNEHPSQEMNHNYEISSPVIEPQKQEPLTLKAFNPYEFAENLPAKEKQKFLHVMMHNKTYAGLTHFINFDKSVEVPQFFNSFKSQNYENKDWIQNPLHLDDLFEHQDPSVIKRKLQQIQQEITDINKKSFSEINISHTILPAFAENFDNFRYLNSHINFIKDLEISMLNFAQRVKENQETELIVKIYEFWMKTFTNFVMSVKRHTERYTLSMVKKAKDSESNSNHEGKSTSSSRIMESDKRKAWKPSELQLLQKIILSNSAYSQSTINKVAEQLNRTPASVSSKIQKLIKDHKAHNPDYEVHENMTLLQKVINVLKNYPNGLSRESVIERVNEHYEMGYDMNWSKSVAQMLSSRPQFVRLKGTFSLNGAHKFDMSKKAFKDKVINCLLTIPSGKADLKNLVDQYIKLYGTSEGISILSQERRKTIQASISKSLCRYDIFNKDKSKTVYKLRQFCDNKDIQQEIGNFIS